jgi:hypothetical protein
VANQVTNAQVINSTAVSEMQKVVEIISILLEVLDYAQLIASQPNTEESLLELKCQKETGFGQLSGCYQKMLSMEIGHHLVKSTLLNPEVI